MDSNLSIFLLHFSTNVLINFDHGIIPACTTDLKLDLGIDDVQDLWDQLFMQDQQLDLWQEQEFLINSKQNKLFQEVSYVAYLVFYFLFQQQIFTFYLYQDFLLDSFKQEILIYLVFLVIFFPVWIDLFGENHKTLWLTYMQLGVALGTVSGYLVTSLALFFSSNWYYPYYLQILLLVPCLIFYSLCDESCLSTQNNEDQQVEKQNFSSVVMLNLKTFFQNPIFVLTMLSLSSLFFVVTGVQFWITDYLRNVMLMSQDYVFQAFLLVSLTAPLSGVYLGGLILHYFGGYDGNQAMQIAALEAFLASLSGAIIPTLDDGKYVLLFLWFLLFFGGSAVPAIMGIMITSIPREQRSSGNSLSHFFQELLGYLPAPVLYGYVQQLTGGQTSRWGMILLSIVGFFGFIYIVIGAFLKAQKSRRIDISFNDSMAKEIQQQNRISPQNNDVNFNTDFPFVQMIDSVQPAKRQTTSKKSNENNLNQHELESPLIIGIEKQRIRTAYSRQGSALQTCYNFTSLIGRGSLDNDIFMVREDHRLNKKLNQNEIELKVAGGYYLVSEGRYVN